jgi:hypothetical protein
MILKLKSSRWSSILVLSWPLSSNSRNKSKNDANEAVSVVAMHFHIVKMYKYKELKMSIIFFVNVWRKNIFDIYVTEYGTALTNILHILFLSKGKSKLIII